MSWNYVFIGGGLLCALTVLLVIGFLIWGVLHLRGSQNQAESEITKVELADIERLTKECVEVFRDKLGVQLDLHDCDTAAEQLDEALADRAKIKDTFARDDFYWYFAKPVGAALGELLRIHGNHQWVKEPDQAPSMIVKLKDGTSTVYPFEKVLKQVSTGDPGDIVAYVTLAVRMQKAK